MKPATVPTDKNPDNIFEQLPIKGRKRRRVGVVPVVASENKDTMELPSMTAPSPHATTTAMYHVPGGGTGVGIAPLDTTLLCGSQRIGIIGLPKARLSYAVTTTEHIGTGKSTCCKSLLSDLASNYPVISVFSGSEADNPFYSLCIPKLFIQTRITRKGLKQFINRQRLAISHDSPLKDALLILDDCFESPSSLDNDMMRIIYKQGRHLRASVWCEQGPLVTSLTLSHVWSFLVITPMVLEMCSNMWLI